MEKLKKAVFSIGRTVKGKPWSMDDIEFIHRYAMNPDGLINRDLEKLAEGKDCLLKRQFYNRTHEEIYNKAVEV
jgi:hypothetical protein